MKKIMVLIALVVSAVLIKSGFMLRAQTSDVKIQLKDLAMKNKGLIEELGLKRDIKESEPKKISDAFTLFVNQTRLLGTYSGAAMNISLGDGKEYVDVEGQYVNSPFRNVKALDLTIDVQKFSNETDMVEVLNDVYLLENRSDFKISSIESEQNDLIVKGELYGI